MALNFPVPSIPFSKRTTSAVAFFPCIFIASARGAQAFTTVPTQIAALQLSYGTMINLYPTLIHQNTANNDAGLDTAINQAVIIISSLVTTLAGLTVLSTNQFALKQMQLVVANSLQNLLNAQLSESLPDPD